MELQKKFMKFGGKKVIVYTKPELEPKVVLSDMTKDELITLAKQSGVEVSNRMAKAKILEALESANV